MSIQLIHQYYAKVDKMIRYSGTRNESTLRKCFQDLIEQYAHSKGLELVPEVEYVTKTGRKVYPDGTLKDALRQDWGYWESKDEKDDLTQEIHAKLTKGYPTFNILFEDTHTAVLYQNGGESMRADFTDAHALDALLSLFVGYEPPEVQAFHKAIQQFTADVPNLANALREIIAEQFNISATFQTALCEFLELCKKAINPKVEMADVREMIIQHVLTEDIFMRVFDDAEFHRDNVIAHKLQEVAGTFYHSDTKRNIHARIAPYYETINARASQISDHHEKQKFLKALYENFYKSYNPKAADRLGVIYTPDEIVRFMIESADHLVFKHFGKTLGDKGVEILDPATGTGTFITELIETLPPMQLDYKYEHEIHCNEVAILPYYIANLNIEFTYKQKTGKYKEFEHICFVDTLDNMGFEHTGQQINFFGIGDENAARITEQNTRKISVVIGNPPYNANQLNENENNKNREYPEIDKRIKETYIKYSTAQKTKLYDMYARFYRWASDRLDKNGMIAFISNHSFLNSRTFDGFRKVVADEFSFIYIVDLGGNVRINPKLSGPKNNVFAIQTGVAIAFLVKKDKKGKSPAQIYYSRRPEMELAREKLEYLRTTKFADIKFENIHPDKNYNWLNIAENDWDEFIPIYGKKTRNAIFSFNTTGISTNRDEWVIDFSSDNLSRKMNFFINFYSSQSISTEFDPRIKWSRDLKKKLLRGENEEYNKNNIMLYSYRPYFSTFIYYSKLFVDILGGVKEAGKTNNIFFAVCMSYKKFECLVSKYPIDLHYAGDTKCFPLYYGDGIDRRENITDWSLLQFQKHYKDKNITKESIFHFVYAVLHNPAYRTKYEQNLKREFPHIPFYTDFWTWVAWGKQLMELHLNYEQVEPYPLEVETNEVAEGVRVSPRLIARKDSGVIEVDTITKLRGIPAEVWEYRLGTYSALEWILERYKEKTPKDPTIREKFNTYRFADYKEQVIDLLMRVCTVSVETIRIISQMPK